MTKPFVILALAVTVLASARAGDPYYVPHGLDAKAITRTWLSDYAKPGYVFSELAGAKLVQAHALLFRARVDDRPLALVVDVCVVGSEVIRGGTTEWLLMTFYRHPYGPRVRHTQWTLGQIGGVHSDISLRRLTVRPTNKTIQDYLEWSRWDEHAADGFKDIHYLCFPAAWRSLTGSEPAQPKDALLWPPKD